MTCCNYQYQSSLPALDIRLELNPPSNPDNIPAYFNKFLCLLKYTKSFSISSHPIGSISGFDRSFNLARYLRLKIQNVDILFHVTCKDLNKVNIFARLTLLRTFEIHKLLVVTGEEYELPELNKELYYANSKELVDDIFAQYNDWFQSVSIAGYPGCNLKENQIECERLRRKISSGSNSIHTQCVFSANQYKEFEKMMKDYDQSLHIVPSIAIFKDLNHLKRISKLMRVKLDEQLINKLYQLDHVDSERYSKDFLINLCKQLRLSSLRPCLNICTFNAFEITVQVLEELGLKSESKSEQVNC